MGLMDKLAYIATMFIVFSMSTCNAQDFVSNDDFKNTIAKDIVAVEFWAEWNAANEFKDLIKLKDCEVYRVDISSNMDTQLKYNVSAIPTVIVFENGTEQARFNANIMFKLEADKKTIQHSVDTLILNKFQ
jgi:thioredoxin-like negative regulator of GroEL